jgi:hypothetical protein
MRHAVVVFALLAVLFPKRALAQVQAPIVVTPGGGVPTVEDSPRGEQNNLGPGSYKLFDTFNTIRRFQLDIGPIYTRQIQEETPAQRLTGFEHPAPLASEIGLGMAYQTPYKPFYLVGRQRTLLRILDDKSFSWSIFQQDLGGGMMLGPFEPDVQVGLSVLTADIFHGEPSIQLFSPRVSAGIGLHAGRLRVELRGHAEYLWRWFGPDYLVRGITLGIGLDQPKARSPLEEPRDQRD